MKPTFEQWINEDQALNDTLVKIQEMDCSVLEQAEFAFKQLSKMYDLPLMPEDLERYEDYFESRNITDPRSVYEEAVLIKYLEPQDDPRGIVLFAVYNVKHGMGVNLKDVFKKNAKKVFRNSRLGIKGNGINTSIIFLKDTDNWVDLECNVMIELI